MYPATVKSMNIHSGCERALVANIKQNIQGPAEIPDDLVTQLLVEPLAYGICP